jgi:DNA mismatch repair protein MutL
VVALGITVSPAFLDVNVHPRKSEIKFLHERAIFAGVQEAVEMVVQRLAPAYVEHAGATLPWEERAAPWADTVAPDARTDAWEAMPVPALRVGETPMPYDLGPVEPDMPALRPLGQVGNTFVVASGPQGLLVLDQHAAHESLLYEQLMAAEPSSLELEEAFVLHLSVSQSPQVARLYPVLATLGFELEPFGRDTVLVRAVPAVLHALLRPGSLLEALQDATQRATPQSSPDEWREHLAAALACRTAMRAGDPLSPAQMAALVAAVTQHHLAYACPHGRPTHVTLSLAELERRFLRLTPPR